MIIGRHAKFRALGTSQRFTTQQGGRLEIGEKAFFNDGVTITATTSVTIGDFVKIANFVIIVDTDFHQVRPDQDVVRAPIAIGNNVWLGVRSVILAGSKIGDNSVIAAGSIVRGEIPPCSVAAGAPARVIRTFEVPDGWVRD